MTAVPSFLPVTLPLWFTVATSSAFVLQVTVLSSVVFAGTSVAVSVSLSFFRISIFDLSSRTSWSGLAFTVTLQVAVFSPQVAVIVVVPAPTAVTRPFFTVATEGSSLFHSIGSVGLPVSSTFAFNCMVPSFSSVISLWSSVILVISPPSSLFSSSFTLSTSLCSATIFCRTSFASVIFAAISGSAFSSALFGAELIFARVVVSTSLFATL